MKWQHLDNGDWMAVGANGDFLLWRERHYWKMRYRTKDKVVLFFGGNKDLRTLKKQCQENHYWER